MVWVWWTFEQLCHAWGYIVRFVTPCLLVGKVRVPVLAVPSFLVGDVLLLVVLVVLVRVVLVLMRGLAL